MGEDVAQRLRLLQGGQLHVVELLEPRSQVHPVHRTSNRGRRLRGPGPEVLSARDRPSYAAGLKTEKTRRPACAATQPRRKNAAAPPDKAA
jgi:hypothetical protein